MKAALVAFLALPVIAVADIPAVQGSLSPDGKIHAVMDVDRDPSISPKWNDDSLPQIEITEKETGQVLLSIAYFGSPGDDKRPLRDHVRVSWRSDSQAFAITVDDRFYSLCKVFARSEDSNFVNVSFPSYQVMTGFPIPDGEHLRPRGRATVEGWSKEGLLIHDLFAVPLPSFASNDPLIHRIFLDVSADRMTPVKVEHEQGEWRRGDWIPIQAEQGDAATSETPDA